MELTFYYLGCTILFREHGRIIDGSMMRKPKVSKVSYLPPENGFF
jgi:hypothetical protein